MPAKDLLSYSLAFVAIMLHQQHIFVFVVVDYQVELIVADKCIGIAKEDLVNIFNQFYRVPAGPSKIKGIDRGLFISKEIMEALVAIYG